MEELSKILLGLLLASRVASPITGGGGDSQGQAFNAFVSGTGGASGVVMAVLPFDNVSEDPNASKKVTNNVISYIAGQNVYGIVDPNKVEKALGDAKVRTLTDVDAKAARTLGDSLQCDVLLIGMITDYGDTRIDQETFPILSVTMRMIDVRDAKILWTSSVTKVGGYKGSLFKSGKTIPMPALTQGLSSDLASQLRAQEKTLVAYLQKGPSEAERVAAAAPAPAVVAVSGLDGVTRPGPAPMAAPAPLAPVPAAVAPPSIEAPSISAPAVAVAAVPSSEAEEENAPAPASKAAAVSAPAEALDAELAQMVPEVPDFDRSNPIAGKVLHNSLMAFYRNDSITVRLKAVDYEEVEKAKESVQHYFKESEPLEISGGVAAKSQVTDMGLLKVGIPYGQFGLYFEGSKDEKEAITAFIESVLNQIAGK